jgi:hypothetical protein
LNEQGHPNRIVGGTRICLEFEVAIHFHQAQQQQVGPWTVQNGFIGLKHLDWRDITLMGQINVL